MENKILVVDLQEFLTQHQSLIRTTIQEEIKKIQINSSTKEEILTIDDLSKLLQKSKQTIFNWMNNGIIKGHYLNDSLYFYRSEIFKSLKNSK